MFNQSREERGENLQVLPETESLLHSQQQSPGRRTAGWEWLYWLLWWAASWSSPCPCPSSYAACRSDLAGTVPRKRDEAGRTEVERRWLIVWFVSNSSKLKLLLVRRRDKRSARRSECWLEREEGEWEAFPPPKIFHLSQRMNPRLAPDSPLYLTGGLGGYENRGYQRWTGNIHRNQTLLFHEIQRNSQDL